MVAERERPQAWFLENFSTGSAIDKIWIGHVVPECMMGVSYAAWPGAIRSMRWRRCGGNARPGWPVIDEVVLEEAGHGRHCCLRRDALLQFARLFINKAQENVIAAQRLTDMTYTRLL